MLSIYTTRVITNSETKKTVNTAQAISNACTLLPNSPHLLRHGRARHHRKRGSHQAEQGIACCSSTSCPLLPALSVSFTSCAHQNPSPPPTARPRYCLLFLYFLSSFSCLCLCLCPVTSLARATITILTHLHSQAMKEASRAAEAAQRDIDAAATLVPDMPLLLDGQRIRKGGIVGMFVFDGFLGSLHFRQVRGWCVCCCLL